MIHYTSENERYIFNPARHAGYKALCDTINTLYGKEATEVSFRDMWLKKMEESGVIADGWYSPPPYGTAVLTGKRLNFDSLRNEYNWSGDYKIDWTDGLLYAYCSPIDKESGIIGDSSVTLYFGSDERIKDHFKKCMDATREVFESLENADTAADLFRISGHIFSMYGLRSNVISRTDGMPTNLGHTFPTISSRENDNCLTENEKSFISSSRKFLNASADWSFTNGMQFTVEPQLISADDPGLPKVTQHYLVEKNETGFTVCNDIDSLIISYTLGQN